MTEDERRRSQRHRTLKAGKIILSRGASVIDCTVRNLSETGACIEVDSIVGIPSTFEFVLPERCYRTCRVVWANGGRLLSRFTAPARRVSPFDQILSPKAFWASSVSCSGERLAGRPAEVWPMPVMQTCRSG